MDARSESDVKKGCLEYLKILENLREIVWVDRLNSGEIYVRRKKGKRQKIALCRKGTPDIYVRFKTGKTVWIETKSNDKKKLSPEQILFRLKHEAIGDKYLIITTVHDLKKRLFKDEE